MGVDRGVLGPYVGFDGLPPLHAREVGLPLAHPYGQVVQGRSVTPGGGRLTVEEGSEHHRITLDHLGCDAQATPEKHEAFKQLALAAEAHCLLAGCRHPARFASGNVHRCFEFPQGAIELRVFVRALLCVELGDHTLLDRLVAAAAEAAGPVRPAQARG
ncbi:hypothetical protein GCM10009760_55590 [Kitasatospora kazusensis]|uniref:Uncharacterized protein n=1 Tax=Kitasatospora kazusensis TaxID=407974 RepID=A0ABN3A7F5_9ACTN